MSTEIKEKDWKSWYKITEVALTVGVGVICIQRAGEPPPDYRRTEILFLFFPAEFNDWKQNSKSFINLQKEHVFFSIFHFPLCSVFHTLPLLSICLDSKLLPDRESSQLWNDILYTRILLFSQVWNVNLWTRILVGLGAFFSLKLKVNYSFMTKLGSPEL